MSATSVSSHNTADHPFPLLFCAELGRAAWKKNVADFSEFIINIIERRINPDTVPRFGDLLLNSKEDRMLDSLSLKEEARRKKLQAEWLKANELE